MSEDIHRSISDLDDIKGRKKTKSWIDSLNTDATKREFAPADIVPTAVNISTNITHSSEQQHLTEEQFRFFDQPRFIITDKDLTSPPGSPGTNLYIVGPSATGDWSGQDNNIAGNIDGGWVFLTVTEGYQAYLLDENKHVVYTGAAWVDFGVLLDISRFFLDNFEEQFDFLITSDGSIITGSLEKTGGGDLIAQWSDGHDVLTPKTITITAGTDEVPVFRYYYILQTAKNTIVEGSAWPSAEHIKIDKSNIPSAAFIQTRNVYTNQNINNDLSFNAGDKSGGYNHLSQTLRESVGSTYQSGLAGAVSGVYLDVAVAGEVFFKMDAGVVRQMHQHAFNAIDTEIGGDVVLIRNHDITPWKAIANLYDIIDDAAGGSLNNRFFTIVVIGLNNKDLDYVYINLPNGTYPTLPKAKQDASKFVDSTIEANYKGVATPICEMVIEKTGGSWVVHQTEDLRNKSVTGIGNVVVGTYSDSDTELVIDAEIVDGQSIDNAIDALIATHGGIADDHHSEYLDSDAVNAIQILVTLALTGDITMADGKKIKIGDLSGGDLIIEHTGSTFGRIRNETGFLTIQSVNGILQFESFQNPIDFFIGTDFRIRDIDDSFIELYKMDSDNRISTNGLPADPVTRNQHGEMNILAGSLILDGSGSDDEVVKLPYLTQAPATLANGMMWMEADGVHIYRGGAEKILTDS